MMKLNMYLKGQLMYHAIEYQQGATDIIHIDVRTKKEYLEGHIPGAYHLPLFTDSQRAEIGTLYKSGEVEAAKRRGVQLVSSVLPTIFDYTSQLQKKYPKHRLVFYCARGGYRSKSISLFLRSIDVPVYWIRGGYKSYRKSVRHDLLNLETNPQFVVLHGLSGVGKTQVLHELQKRGEPIIDLEMAANHKGSHFGAINTSEHQSQQTFENNLYTQFHAHKSPYYFIESESRKIGSVVIPKSIFEQLNRGVHVLLNASIDYRTELIINDYAHASNLNKQLNINLLKIKPYVSSLIFNELLHYNKVKNHRALVRTLLEHHYDPLYFKSLSSTCFNHQIEVKSSSDCADEIMHLKVPILST